MEIAGLPVTVVRKDIRNLHVAVYPPEGSVRISAPYETGDEVIRTAVIDKLSWIRRQQDQFQHQERQTPREMVSGESHYFLGNRYLLSVSELEAAPSVSVRGMSTIEMTVRPGTGTEKRSGILAAWHRAELRDRIEPMISSWSTVLDVEVGSWAVRHLKTRWGSCNTSAGTILFNTELVKKPQQCIEYLVVHELIHLIEAGHTPRFHELMNQYFPTWQHARDLLNAEPLAFDTWTY